MREFAPVAVVGIVPFVVVVTETTPIKTPQKLIAYAKANPKKLSFSSSGVGNPQQLAGELMNIMANVEVLHMPYRLEIENPHGLDCWLLLLVRAGPAQPDAETDQISAKGGLRLRPDPPCRPVVAAMLLRIGGRERTLAHAPLPVQCRNRDAALVTLERCHDSHQCFLTAHEVHWDANRHIRHGSVTGKPRWKPIWHG